MAYSPILTTLGYVVRDDTVLMCHRIARGYDEQYGKWNGLGGKLEADEDAAAGMIRELAEEADIVPTAMTLRGTLNWPGFSGPDGHVFGFVFLVTAFTGEPPARNEEGDLVWVPRADLMNLDMWEGDRYFLPLLFDDDPRMFHAVIPYADGRPTGATITRL
ncbi:NUDIX hydrolase [Granulicoccus phenolivorans]|uniref:NUDIX hydrolase n=1 Tax=Granulicoccus phenolivorans TaxID=266854 RepID=UPI000419324A|nr:8-oxo-dGTP diphosphatase [Granulicoccus phenolivorans]